MLTLLLEGSPANLKGADTKGEAQGSRSELAAWGLYDRQLVSVVLDVTHESFFGPLGLEVVPLADMLFILNLFFVINEI